MSVTDSTVTTPARPSANPRTGARGTTARDPVELTARAAAITERELAVYADRTKASQAATDRARKVMPAGVPSSFQAYDPRPIVVKHSSGSTMIDLDDNVYVDYDMGFGALFAGHMNPAVRRAVRAQLTTARCTSRRASSTRRWASCWPIATASRCGGRRTRAPKRRWTRSASRVVSPVGTSW